MIIEASCSLRFTCEAPVPSIFMLRPKSGQGQFVMREDFLVTPAVPMTEFIDGFGNLCQRLVIPAGGFSIESRVIADCADGIDVNPRAEWTPIEELPDNVLQYTLPSRFCEADKLFEAAKMVVGDCPPGYARVEAIRHWIHKNIRYAYGTSNSSTSAVDTWDSRTGVCRDFAHLGISFCRAFDIPARMVTGYLHQLKPMDLHAWFEAFIGGHWYSFDATQTEPRGNRITMAYGRDAADVAFATHFGTAVLTEMAVSVSENKRFV